VSSLKNALIANKNHMKKLKAIALGLAFVSLPLLLSGCASATCGSREAVSLYSKPTGAEVIVYNNHGAVVYQGIAPCETKLERTPPESGRANYIVLFKKKGFQPAQIQLKSVMTRAGLANVFGGVGYLVDSGTGGMWTLQPTGKNPDLLPSPDMLRPDGLCVGLKDESPNTVAVKLDAFGE
jgi:hypothetical protein